MLYITFRSTLLWISRAGTLQMNPLPADPCSDFFTEGSGGRWKDRWGHKGLLCMLLVPVSILQETAFGFKGSLQPFQHLETKPPGSPERYYVSALPRGTMCTSLSWPPQALSTALEGPLLESRFWKLQFISILPSVLELARLVWLIICYLLLPFLFF